jgi:hypothetical protein
MGRPEVLLAEMGVRTTVRRRLEFEFLETVERLRREFGELMGVQWSIADVKAAEATLLRARLAGRRAPAPARSAAQQLPRADSPVGPDDRARAELHRRRRARVENRATTEIKQARAELAERLRKVELDRIASLTEVDRLTGLFLAEIDHARTIFMAANAVYEDALLRRHPQGDLLRVLLDTTDFALPDWFDEWAGEGGREHSAQSTDAEAGAGA